MTHPNQAAQDLCRDTMDAIMRFIVPGMTERQIKEELDRLLVEKGATSFWYHGLGGACHVGARTLTRRSGRAYNPTDTKVQNHDIITVDLAPAIDGYWGDFTRTVFVEDGSVVLNEDDVQDEKYAFALKCEKHLHAFVLKTAVSDMTYEQLYYLVQEQLEMLGAQNLDPGGNFGHSLNFDQADRVYIMPGNTARLADYPGFTFEPFLQCKDCDFGIRRENIYYFDENHQLKEL